MDQVRGTAEDIVAAPAPGRARVEPGSSRSSAPFHVVRQEACAVLTLDHPPVNALDAHGYRAVTAALADLDSDPAIRAIVVTGAGSRAFCAGTDMAGLAPGADLGELTTASLAFFETLSGLRTPLVGALNGPAVGGGAMIAAECDVLTATRNARLGVPELQLGFPGAGSHIARLVPRPVALRMLLLGEQLSADRMLEMGLLVEVVDETQQLRASAERCAKTIAALDPVAVRGARGVLRGEADARALAGYREELNLLIDVLSR
ncbi:enoyl-CoA hydratase/isomerase family protein [Streptomyces sp. NPDC101455]|uniref:enoyl-CoA hydratase/isomerase family protein n=1 Tax=Streptomyces sp. NPDC101455 TaxID=3366142 RepID=UPI0037F90DBA